MGTVQHTKTNAVPVLLHSSVDSAIFAHPSFMHLMCDRFKKHLHINIPITPCSGIYVYLHASVRVSSSYTKMLSTVGGKYFTSVK